MSRAGKKIRDHQKQWTYISNIASENLERRVYTDVETRLIENKTAGRMLKFIRGKGQQPSAERQKLQNELFAFRKNYAYINSSVEN
ncbi:unnamed protein product, partial [Leptidea sinapis]